MTDAQKPDHVSLNTLISRLREGRFVIPDFQREFEWQPWDIRDLMRSIFLDYYIGSLLLWSGNKENFEVLSCEDIYGHKGGTRREYIVLDGQQRLTAMYYAFLAPDILLPGRKNRFFYFLRVDQFMDEQYDRAFKYDWTRSWTQYIHDHDRQYADHIFPLSLIGAKGYALPNWLQGYEEHWKSNAESQNDDDIVVRHADNASRFGDYIKTLTDQYQISYIELDKELGIDKICDIFTQVNSKGVQLDTFDLINALLRPQEIFLKQMWRDASPRFGEFVESTKMNIYILQVMSILRQNYCSPKYLYFLIPGKGKPVRDATGARRTEVLVTDKDAFIGLWKDAVNAIEHAVGLLQHPQEYGAISSKYLPYTSIISVFSAIQFYVRNLPASERLRAQQKIRYWYWASVFQNRYSGSVDSTAARDFLDLKSWISNGHESEYTSESADEPHSIVEFKMRFRDIDLHREVRRGTSVYNGIFNLLVIHGARDWVGGDVPRADDLDDHHIVPASKGKSLEVGDLIHSILNRSPLTEETNRQVIRDLWPNEYLPIWMDQVGRDVVCEVLQSHFISLAALEILLRDPFTSNDYEDFLAERKRTFLDAIESLLIKKRIHLLPQLRLLDRRIECIELALRDTISKCLEGDLRRLPPHVIQKANERIQAAVKKNLGTGVGEDIRIKQLLEHCDLRELEDTIFNKKLWELFAEVFVSKGTLGMRFDQLSELRNRIRHSRPISGIVRSDGEAAILWFEKVLVLGESC